MRRYALVTEITDDRPGWPVPPRRVLPRAYTIRVQRYVRNDGDRARELTDAELAELVQDPERAGDWLVGYRNWLVLSVETSATQPPRCVTLHAPRGIGTPELRFPLAGIVTEASAMLASRKRASGDPPGPLGQHLDLPGPIEYEDVVLGARPNPWSEALSSRGHGGAPRRGRPHRRREPSYTDRSRSAPLQGFARLRAPADQARTGEGGHQWLAPGSPPARRRPESAASGLSSASAVVKLRPATAARSRQSARRTSARRGSQANWPRSACQTYAGTSRRRRPLSRRRSAGRQAASTSPNRPATRHRTALNLVLLRTLGNRHVDELAPCSTSPTWSAGSPASGKARESIRKRAWPCSRWCSTTPASRRTRRATGSS